MKKWLVMLLSIVFLSLTLIACSDDSSSTEGNTTAEENTEEPANTSNENEGAEEEEAEAEPVTLSFFTALPDRESGMGGVEQAIIDAYVAENPHVKIEVEALQDEPFKDKIKIYSSTNDLPDIIQAWGQSSFIAPLIDNGLLHELDPADFEDKGFIEGSFGGFSKDGKVYGVPKNTDFLPLFINKRMFEENGLEPPTTEEELIAVSKEFNDLGINPVVTNGMDGWILPMWFDYALQRETGSFDLMDEALAGEASYTDQAVIDAATKMKKMVDEGVFAEGFLTADYGTARNLFGQEQAAMYLMGAWEMGLATDENFPESFREDVGVIPYPVSDNAEAGDLVIYQGGGYSIAENSENKEEAVKFLQYFFQPENWAKQAWQSGAGMPAQNFDQFLTGDESDLQKEMVDIFNSVTSASGTPVLDDSTPEFKETIMSLHQQLYTDEITPEEFAEQLEAAAAKAREASE
ncbi:extracellular solute-binding protein [Aquibacillus koreensis]|uniref:Extracellular solute-binding protein n=1 Tax=Aquibacillus koreensis TaxID=279446 RepID=A0A9X3WHQ9_9BACI|nr:extracellular solute-binding protein [Aquibacillus koreensis]MCT2537072.1 extracellular solute-binding protein [Aquibacillus koreensis]MDC3419945.1 extracellular solute-binding protein [Aquibacillus koreensis]